VLTAEKLGFDLGNLPPVLSVRVAAIVADRKPRTIRKWMRDGLIDGHRPGGGAKSRAYIDTESLLRYLRGGD
jgi:hypothetical protein